MPHRKFFHPALHEHHELQSMTLTRVLAQGLATGAISGLVIGLFRMAYTFANRELPWLYMSHRGTLTGTLLTIAVLAGLALVAWLCLRHEPLISGSGIPHVELVVRGKLPMPWFRILWTKFIGTLASLMAGLSIGREGPCIQMGAAVGCGVGALWHHNRPRPRYLVGGSTAGMAAAFGAPLAGMLFAFEEMRTIISLQMVLFTASAAAAAWFVVDIVLKLGLVFPLAQTTLALHLLWLVPLVGVACGLLSAGYNLLLVRFTLACDRHGPSQPWRLALAFALTGVLAHFFPEIIVGIGPGVCDVATGAYAFSFVLLLWGVKILFNVASFASGVSGGLLMPMLLAGGYTGALFASIGTFLGLPTEATAAVVILGMAGLFAGTVRAPLTGAFLITEMTGCWILLPCCIVCALCAAWTASLLKSPPVYDSLRNRQLHNFMMKRRKPRKDDLHMANAYSDKDA